MDELTIVKKLVNHGEHSFYLIDESKFIRNFQGLLKELNGIFPYFNIAYSYKTNYVPSLCKLIKDLGGYAEVVSSMEYKIAETIGMPIDRIIFNGPIKERKFIYKVLTNGGSVNIDNIRELEDIEQEFRGKRKVNIALRCNYPSSDGVVSRFGIDIESDEFKKCLDLIVNSNHLNLIGMHAHIANRGLDVWADKVNGLCNIIEKYDLFNLKFIDFGGGIYGGMPPELKSQFNSYIPTFEEYAKVIATPVKELFARHPHAVIPQILIEPGSAIVGDAMKFVCIVDSIKDIRGKKIATVTGSMYNINPTLNHKNPPVEVIHKTENCNNNCNCEYDIAGYTCIESDYLYKGYKGYLNTGAIMIFGNVGSYSIVLKPPFILPNFPVYQYNQSGVQLVKNGEVFDDLFHTYKF